MLPDGRRLAARRVRRRDEGGGGREGARADARPRAGRRPPSGMKLYDDPDGEQHIWDVREAGLGATAFIPGKADTHEGWEDSAVAARAPRRVPARLSKLADDVRLRERPLRPLRPGLRPRPLELRPHHAAGDREVPALVPRTRPTSCSARRLAVRRARRRPGARRAPAEDVRRRPRRAPSSEFKSIWDPDWKMNPGKVVDPYRVDENLRLGADYEPWQPQTNFGYPDDDGDFAHATAPLRRRRQVPRARAESTSCARASWRPARRSTRRAAAPTCCSRCSSGEVDHRGWQSRRGDARRSTSASPARAARTTARSTSTCPPTRPSSCPTAGSTGSARAMPTRSG